jgi:hypothetical protein
MAKYSVVTSFELSPLAPRSMDWRAYYDGDEDSGEEDCGFGSTEDAAILDLIQNFPRI